MKESSSTDDIIYCMYQDTQ